MEKGGWVYIMADRYRGGMYVGVTADIVRRVYQHREGTGSQHVADDSKIRLVYAERHEEIEPAIAREKLVKKWKRSWKFALIEADNPDWDDLWIDWFPDDAEQRQRGPVSSTGRRDDLANSKSDTLILSATVEDIAKAAAIIATGGCVAVPTETVYGLAADATNGEAVAGIFAAKGRPSFNPLIVHVPDLAAAERIADFSDAARDLAERYWPGPLTLVLPLRADSGIASLVTAGLPTIAIRVPAHPVMQALLGATGKPLAAPSANASGGISPTRAEHVMKSLGGRIPLILDGGPTSLGLESTIVATDPLRLLRPGPIDLGLQLIESGSIEAPGQLASHYAPSKPLRINATAAEDGEWLIGFGANSGNSNLSETGDLQEAAARLFDLLHQADAAPGPCIAVAPIPNTGLGLAINDRLRRAAA